MSLKNGWDWFRNSILVMILVWVGLGLVFHFVVTPHLLQGYLFSSLERWSLYSFLFFLSWWFVYFLPGLCPRQSLRNFLNKWVILREERPLSEALKEVSEKRIEEAFISKASSSLSAKALFIAAIALFLYIIVTVPRPLSDFQEIVYWVVIFFAFLSLIFFAISTDVMDTVANLFRRGTQSDSHIDTQKYFYLSGAYYPYIGYAAFYSFLMLSFSFFHPLFAGLWVGVFIVLGYGYWFGDIEVVGEDVKKPQRKSCRQIIAIIVGLGFVVATVCIWLA